MLLVQMRAVVPQPVGSTGDEKQSDSGYILKVYPSDTEMKDVKAHAKMFGWWNWMKNVKGLESTNW